MHSSVITEIEFDPVHIHFMELRAQERDSLSYLNSTGVDEHFKRLKEASFISSTFKVDDLIICAAGMIQPWPGVIEGWVLPTKFIGESQSLARNFCSLMAAYVEAAFDEYDCCNNKAS